MMRKCLRLEARHLSLLLTASRQETAGADLKQRSRSRQPSLGLSCEHLCLRSLSLALPSSRTSRPPPFSSLWMQTPSLNVAGSLCKLKNATDTIVP